MYYIYSILETWMPKIFYFTGSFKNMLTYLTHAFDDIVQCLCHNRYYKKKTAIQLGKKQSNYRN